jgi:uncharacterized membrane protein YbhN (UPF0104 family)
MTPWWFLCSALFVTGVYTVASAVAKHITDRRWARMIREQDRRKLRYETWAAMARLGGW